MNKKKLPKVIVCRNDEAHPATAPSAAAIAAGQQAPAEYNRPRNITASEPQSEPADNVVHMIRPAVSASPDRDMNVSERRAGIATSSARRRKAQAIVDRHAAYSAVGGLLPLALANFAGVTAINVRMVKVLCRHYGVPFQQDRARAFVIGLIGGAMPTGTAAIATSTLLYIMPPTALLGVAVSSATAAVFTRAVGRVFIEHFEDAAFLQAASAP